MLRQTAHIAAIITLALTVALGTAGAFVTPPQPTTGPCCSAA